MKRTPLFLLIAMIVVALGLSTGIRCYADGDDSTPIIIGDFGTNGLPIFHSPALVPIQAAYYPSFSTILVNYRFDLGTVTVEIENLTTAEHYQTTVDATQGVHPYQISGSSGNWVITFTLSGGSTYGGSFEIE